LSDILKGSRQVTKEQEWAKASLQALIQPDNTLRLAHGTITTVTQLFTLYILCLHSDYTAVAIKRTIFWDVKSCTLIKIHGCFRGMHCLHLQDRRHSSNLKIQAAHYSETSVYFYQTIQHGTLEDRQLHNLNIHKVNAMKKTSLVHSDRKSLLYTFFPTETKFFKVPNLNKAVSNPLQHQIKEFCDLLYMFTMKLNFLQYQ
jgi:hypothetical protein